MRAIHWQHNIRLLFYICRASVFPAILVASIIFYTGIHTGYQVIALYVFSVLICAVTRILFLEAVHRREANHLRAKQIPRVIGKWPGNVDVLLKLLRSAKTTYLVNSYLELFEEYQATTLNLRILWVDQIISMDRDHSVFVLATGFDQFWRGQAQRERLETFLGDGIFNRDGERWKLHRSMARPFFSRDRISNFEMFDRHAARAISIISSLESCNKPCEAQDLYARFTLDTASEFLFGKNLDTLSGSLPTPGIMGAKGSATTDSWGSFVQAFEQVQQVISARRRLGYIWPLFEIFGDKTLPHVKIIRGFLDPIVNQVLMDKKAEALGQQTFLEHLAENTDDANVIRDQILNVLLASRDTTASLLTFVTYFMAIHPDVAGKLRAEVLQHYGPNGAPNHDNIRDLRYMRAVINETLRLFPPVPLNMRESRSVSCALPPPDPTFPSTGSELFMPKNTTFLYMPILTQRNPALWGEDADRFDPERWLAPERIAKFASNPMMYTPFSAGPRVCLGQNYAYHEASYFLVRLLQQYDNFTLDFNAQPEASLPPPEWSKPCSRGRQAVEKIWPGIAMTLYIKGGLWIRYGKSDKS